MDERLKFIARLLDGEKMAVVCRAFGISRKTGYKILTRYNAIGLDGLTDRSRRPYRHANQLPIQIETQIVRLKQDKPSWGAPKIREKLSRLYPDVHTPAISTVHAVLDRHGLVKRRMGRRNRAKGTALSLPGQPNDLWCADYKGEFMLADRRYCYPLTITDFASRYLFACEALAHQGSLCVSGVRGRLQGVRLAQGHPHRQRCALRKPQCPLWPQQAVGVVAQARHRDRAHQAWPPAAERTP
jgi:putative transposase